MTIDSFFLLCLVGGLFCIFFLFYNSMMSLCIYKNMFGKVNTGIHSYRLGNIAVVDTLMTIIVAYGVSHFTKFSFVLTLLTLFLLGIFLHRLFCVRTTIDKFLF